MLKESDAVENVFKKDQDQLSMLEHAWNPYTWEAKIGGPQVPGYPWLHFKFKASLGYERTYLKKKKNQKKKKPKNQKPNQNNKTT